MTRWGARNPPVPQVPLPPAPRSPPPSGRPPTLRSLPAPPPSPSPAPLAHIPHPPTGTPAPDPPATSSATPPTLPATAPSAGPPCSRTGKRPLLSNPRRARSKSPSASPCRCSSGNSSPTSWVLRANSGRIRLTKRSSNPRTRGCRNVTVPRGVVSWRGFPYPFRYPGKAPTSARRWHRARPQSSVTSAARTHWTSSCIRSRSYSWRVSQVGIDNCSRCVLCCCMAVSSLLRPVARGFLLN